MDGTANTGDQGWRDWRQQAPNQEEIWTIKQQLMSHFTWMDAQRYSRISSWVREYKFHIRKR